ncbi:hypothetical protein M422DRAFT_38293 [Sphaerobolus stellatus SS14]|uniref:Uncharacterized protein n=1 Tax=Sphaerobolus stellatus (strain SS14) TaxID=990650 RepID=A0A0C9ULZ4_SPHS4|nr:hypothetical protein M422DRAFT_38293 [Sphaerobolus stellatus SS14]
MQHILEEFGYPVQEASPLLIDNQSALNVDEVEANTIKPLYAQSSEQLADMLTKSLSPVKVKNFCGKIGLHG